MPLFSQKCVPCGSGTPPLPHADVEKYLSELKTRWENIDHKKIRYEFKFKDFLTTMDFVNKVAKLAEAENHHPDLHIFYNRVVVELSTHTVKGLSENDFILAAKIEKIFPSS